MPTALITENIDIIITKAIKLNIFSLVKYSLAEMLSQLIVEYINIEKPILYAILNR